MRTAKPGPKYMAIGVGVVFIGWVLSGFAVSNALGILIECPRTSDGGTAKAGD